MSNDLSAITDMWMVNPSMFDPTGWAQTNPYSNYATGPLPWPSTYASVPTNAATGAPIASFQQMMQKPMQSYEQQLAQYNQQKAQQPTGATGTTLNNTQAYPQGYSSWFSGNPIVTNGAPANTSPAAYASVINNAYPQPTSGQQTDWASMSQPWQPGGSQSQQSASSQAPSPPNNWYAALKALANPGNPTTPGATVPIQQGYQPAGGMNNAFLQSQGWGPTGTPGTAPQGGGPVNTNFMSALQAIQGRQGGGLSSYPLQTNSNLANMGQRLTGSGLYGLVQGGLPGQ